MSQPTLPVILLMGPTASGKTAIAVELAARHAIDIISVDSALVYRDMNIGTAKPDAATLQAAPHALVDIISPEQVYSAASFVSDANRLIATSHAAGRIPLLVGGTMLYFKALQDGLSQLPTADSALRAELHARAAREGWPALHAELARLDPPTAARLQPADAQRIERALEICLLSGEPMSVLLAREQAAPQLHRFVRLALVPSQRAALHQRIEVRFRQMLREGLVQEVQQLRELYQLHPELPSMRCVGYRQTWDYLEGVFDIRELENRGIYATRQLCKRQLTWLRGMSNLVEIDCLSPQAMPEVELQLLRGLQPDQA